MDIEAVLGPAPTLDTNLDNIIIVDGLPVIPTDKIEKLTQFVSKKFEEFGPIVQKDLPVDENGTTLGFMFIQYETNEQAQAALALNGKPMDKRHVYRVNTYSDIGKLTAVPDTYTPPSEDELAKPVPPLNSWLNDPSVRDQYALRYMDGDKHKTAIYWNDPITRAEQKGRELIYDGERETASGKNWVEREVHWSPSGAYFCTFHAKGIALWGGAQFERIARFEKDNIIKIQFSPCERYLLTFSVPKDRAEYNFEGNLWDVFKGTVIRSFKLQSIEDWPFLQFSHDGTYITRVTMEGIAIINTATMKLYHSITAHNVKGLVWHPTENKIAYLVPPKVETQPGCLMVYDVDEKKVVREKHIFNILSSTLTWSEYGDYLFANNVIRKTKKTSVYSMSIFRMSVKSIPIDDVVFEHQPSNIVIEPKTATIALTTHVTNVRVPKVELQIYRVTAKEVKKVFTSVYNLSNEILLESYKLHWSPSGNTLLMTYVHGSTLMTVIYNNDKNELTTSAPLEHMKANHVSWDPSGRYFVTAATHAFKAPGEGHSWKDNNDDIFNLYTFKGALLQTYRVSKLFQIQWRPFPRTLLTRQQLEDIKKNLNKTYWSKFYEQDQSLVRAKKAEQNKARIQLKQEWKEFIARCEAKKAEQAEAEAEFGLSVEGEEPTEVLRYVKLIHKD